MAYNSTVNLSIQSNSTSADSALQYTIPSLIIASPEVTSISLRIDAGDELDLSESLTRATPDNPLNLDRRVQFIAIKGDAAFDVSLKQEAGDRVYSGIESTNYIRLFNGAGAVINHLVIKAGTQPLRFTALLGHG